MKKRPFESTPSSWEPLEETKGEITDVIGFFHWDARPDESQKNRYCKITKGPFKDCTMGITDMAFADPAKPKFTWWIAADDGKTDGRNATSSGHETFDSAEKALANHLKVTKAKMEAENNKNKNRARRT